VSNVIPLRRNTAPAYTPMDPPVQCQTPGHEDIKRYPARLRPGGRICEECLPVRDTRHAGRAAAGEVA